MTDRAGRDAFEAWLAGTGMFGGIENGYHLKASIELAWLAWQAATAAERERCAKIFDTTPPEPFGPSIQAAHAIRATKDQQ